MNNKVIAISKKISERSFYEGDIVYIKSDGKYIPKEILKTEDGMHLISTPKEAKKEKWFHSLELEYHNPFRIGQKVKVFSNTTQSFHEGTIKARENNKYTVAWDNDNKYKDVSISKLKEWNPAFHNIHHLFPRGLQEGAIKQGIVGNCYFLAVYEGIFRTYIAQKVIPKMIKEISPFTWSVTYYDPRHTDERGNMGKITTTINIEDLLSINNKLNKGRIGDLILERTFGKAIVEIEARRSDLGSFEDEDTDSYEPNTMELTTLGSMKSAIEILLGKKSQNIYSKDIEKLRPKIKGYSAFISNQLMVAGSSVTPPYNRISPKHAYFVQSYQEETDEIVLINPHDTYNGILKIPLAVFISNFTELRTTDIGDLKKHTS